jgi:hypothetical protein
MLFSEINYIISCRQSRFGNSLRKLRNLIPPTIGMIQVNLSHIFDYKLLITSAGDS